MMIFNKLVSTVSNAFTSVNHRWYAASFGIAAISGTLIFFGLVRQPGHLPAPPPGTQWQQVFNEDFTSDTLDTSKWNTCYAWYHPTYKGCTNSGNDEQEWYTAEQTAIQDGHLTITAKPQPTPGWNGQAEQTYPYISGMVSTGSYSKQDPPKWSGAYGYYEARIRTDGTQGVWPAFWLLAADGSWPPEIDIMELLGQNPNEVLLTYHWGDSVQPKKDETKYREGDFTKGWHTYAINWQPGRIDWYVDGHMRKTQTGDIITDKPMVLVLNLAIGGRLAGNADSTTHFPASMMVDYIRVYQSVRKELFHTK